MAEQIPPDQIVAWVKKKTMPKLEAGFNSFIEFAVSSLPNESPQHTGFYASSWKASTVIPRPTDNYQKRYGRGSYVEPWNTIKLKLRKRIYQDPHVAPRHEIPRFNLTDTVYIANTAVYSQYAFWRPATERSRYGGILPLIAVLPDKAPMFFKDTPDLGVGFTVGGIRY